MATPYAVRAFESWLLRGKDRWRSAVLFAVIGPLMFLGAMGSGLGSLVSDHDPRSLDGLGYGDFVAPGLLAASAMQAAVSEATWPVMGAIKWDRSYHAMLASPLPVADIFYGHLMLMVLRLTMGAVAFGVAASALGHGSAGMLLAVPAAILTGAAFAAPLAAWAVGRESDNAFSMVFRVAIMPMFLFSGTFFPVSSLPAPLEALAVVTPLWHGVELCRGLVLDDLTAGRAALHLAYLLALLTAGLVAGRRTFAKALIT